MQVGGIKLGRSADDETKMSLYPFCLSNAVTFEGVVIGFLEPSKLLLKQFVITSWFRRFLKYDFSPAKDYYTITHSNY